MLECFEVMKGKDFDFLSFLPEDEDNTSIDFCDYGDRGEELEKTKMGSRYHILLYRYKDDSDLDLDIFEATLSCPLTYVSPLIKNNWYGVIAKKTTTSEEFVSQVYKHIFETA